MTVRRLDDNGDIVTQGVRFIGEREEIAQTIRTRLRLFYGEYFRDITDGTPWFQTVLGQRINDDARESVLRERIAKTEGVINLIAFSADFDEDTRKYTVTASVLTKYGELTTEVTNG